MTSKPSLHTSNTITSSDDQSVHILKAQINGLDDLDYVTDTYTGKQTDRQTHRHTYTHLIACSSMEWWDRSTIMHQVGPDFHIHTFGVGAHTLQVYSIFME